MLNFLIFDFLLFAVWPSLISHRAAFVPHSRATACQGENQFWPFADVLRAIWPGVTGKKRVFVFFAEEPTVLLSLAILFFSEGSDIAIVHLTPLFFHVERSRDISECSSVKN
jgi:hypothetical protein